MSDETLVKSLRTPQWRPPHNTPTVSRLNEQAADAIERQAAALAAETARADREATARQESELEREEKRFLLEVIHVIAVDGKVSDFALSFPIVRRIDDMRAERDALRAENAKLRAWLTAANSHHREMSDK